jgi:uncharacterized 2Fe-2S/4Fe-4S cluster protein (DUF4445 family)
VKDLHEARLPAEEQHPHESGSYRLRFTHVDQEITVRANETVYQSARRHGVRIVGACGGRGICGTCLVRLHSGTAQMAGSSEITVPGRRWLRSCCLTLQSDSTVELSPRSLAPIVRTDPEDRCTAGPTLQPAVIAHDLVLSPATLEDNVSDLERLARSLKEPGLTIDLEAARVLPTLLRRQTTAVQWPVRLWRRGQELIGFVPVGSPTLGLAVDLGTTNVAAFLIDLESGAHIAHVGIENPQTAWGADLVSRINQAGRDAGEASRLRHAAADGINALARDLCHSVDRRTQDIADIAICGNTAMHHLLLGLPVRQLGRAPFTSVVSASLDFKARELGLAAALGAWVHLAPNIGGFVGGDHVATLLATEPEWSQCSTALVMDIGTNTEISLIRGGKLWSTSAPSGPALEGGNISCGMRAARGAIERVRMEGGRLAVDVIGRTAAVGLCGSGVLDTVAVLRRGGLVSVQGRLADGHPDAVTLPGRKKRAIRLARSVLFTQDDIRAVQLAKAAIRTATELLAEEAGVDTRSVDRFIVAGAFGAYIDIASGIDIGLFPDLPRERFRQVGNAAGAGVRHLLISVDSRARAGELARVSHYVELSSHRNFQRIYLSHLGFP